VDINYTLTFELSSLSVVEWERNHVAA